MPDFKGLDPIIANQSLPESAPLYNPAPVAHGMLVPSGGGANPESEDLMEYYSRTSDFGKEDQVISGAELKANQRYKAYNPNVINQEDYAAYGQGWVDKMLHGVGKGLALTGTTFIQSTVGMVNGLMEWHRTGKVSSFYDNEMNRTLDKFNEGLEDQWANYYTDAEKAAHWYSPSKLFSANFFWDGIIKNLGFSAGAALSGMVFSAGLGAIGKALSLLPNLGKLVSVGKAAEALAATEAGINEASAAGKAAATYGKVLSESQKFLGAFNTLNTAQRITVAGLATTGEAGFEAYQNLNQFRDEKIAEYKRDHFGEAPTGQALDEINSAADQVGNWSMLFNIALLSATNYIQFPKILGSSYTAEKGMISGLKRETGELIEEGGKFVAAPAGNKFLGMLNKVRPYTFSASEGFEEGAQYAITVGTQDYYDKKYKNEDPQFAQSLMEGIKETLGTDVGMENVVIGGLSGALMLGRGKFRESREEARNTQEALRSGRWKDTGLNTARLSDFMKDTYDAVNRGTVLQKEREKALKMGDISGSKDIEADYIINYLSPRIKHGRYDLVKDELNTYRTLASTEEGYAQLQSEGRALPSDTREAYLNRLDNLEKTADNVKNLYQSLYVRYGSRVDENGKPLYTSEVMDKMVYAASKIADYDQRIPSLSNKLSLSGVNVNAVIEDVTNGSDAVFKQSLVDLDNINKKLTGHTYTDTEIDDLKESLEDIAVMTLRRNQFLKDYSVIKAAPKIYQDKLTTQAEVDAAREAKKSVTIKTKDGEKEIEIGTEYYAGKTRIRSEKGHVLSKMNKITVLKDNGNGTIRVKDSSGQEHDMSIVALENLRLAKVSEADKTPESRFFTRNESKEVFWNRGKGKGGKQAGWIELDPENNQMYFVYEKTLRGKVVEYEHPITPDQFEPVEGFKEGLYTFGKDLTDEDNADIQETKKRSAKDVKVYELHKKEARRKILEDLLKELNDRHEKTNKLIAEKKTAITLIDQDLAKIKKRIDTVGKVNVQSASKKALNAIERLSKAKDELEEEVSILSDENDQLEWTIFYMKDEKTRIEDLPMDVNELLYELNFQLELLNDSYETTHNELDQIKDVMAEAETTMNSAIDFLTDLIHNFKKVYPNTPINTAVETINEFLKANPRFLKYKPTFIDDLRALEKIVAEIEDVDIIPNQEIMDTFKADLDHLTESLKEIEQQAMAKKMVLERFQKAVNDYKAARIDEDRIKNDKEQVKAALETADKKTIETVSYKPGYESAWKKMLKHVWRSTIGIIKGKPHQIRANTFGFNFNNFENKKNIRGLYINAKNENELWPELGLIKFITDNADKPIDPDRVVAMVMVDVSDGSPVMVDVEGKPFTDEQLSNPMDHIIFQVFPEDSMTWSEEYAKTDESGKKVLDTMIRNTASEEDRKKILEEYPKLRKKMLELEDLSGIHEIEASFGLPMFDEQLDENGEVVLGKNGKPAIDYSKQTAVDQTGLVESSADAFKEQILTIPTTNENISEGTTEFNTPLGVPFLQTGNGLLPLKNSKHSPRQAENIYQALYHLATNMLTKDGIKSESSTTLVNYLKSVVYWDIPETKSGERKETASNSVFWEVDKYTGKFMLTISNEGNRYKFTPQDLADNKEEIIALLQDMYTNVNNSLVKKTDQAYDEIVTISPKGDITKRRWVNYQAYLLSSKFWGKDERDPENSKSRGEVPLYTPMKPVTSENPVNRTAIYFYTIDNSSELKLKEPSPKKETAQNQAKEEKEKEKKKDKNKTNSLEDRRDLSRNGGRTSTGEKVRGYNSNKLQENEAEYVDSEGDVSIITGKNKKSAMKKVEEKYDEEAPKKTEKKKEEISKEKLDVSEAPSNEARFSIKDLKAKANSLEVLKVLNDIYDEPLDDDTSTKHRIMIDQQMQDVPVEDWNKLEAWFSANFPHLPIYRVKNIINTPLGRSAWGMFKKNALYIYKNAEVGTAYHEAWHAVWQMFTTPEERTAMKQEFRARPGSFYDRKLMANVEYQLATPDQVEEALAEEFRDYVQYGKIPVKPAKSKPWIVQMFYNLVNYIRSIFNKPAIEEQFNSKVEEMFKRVNEGSFREVAPEYNDEFAFNETGFIDIDEAIAEKGDRFSLTDISDKQRNELMQSMTYRTLADMIETDKNLFNITANQDKKKLYDLLQTAVLKDLARIIKVAKSEHAKGNYSKQKLERIETDTVALMENIVAQWDEIQKRHEEYLMQYNIEFDENDTLQINDPDKIKESDFVEANKVDHFKKAHTAIKLLLATIPVVDGETNKTRLSSIGGVILLPVGQVNANLLNHLHPARTAEEMIYLLRDLAKQDPNYRRLYRRIVKRDYDADIKKQEGGKYLVDLSHIRYKHSSRLLTAFWAYFNKQNPEVKNVYILENGDVVVGDANLSTVAGQLADDYINSIVSKAKEGKGYFKYDEKRKVFVGDATRLRDVRLDSLDSRVNFLHKLGIEFNQNDVDKLRGKNLSRFKESVDGIYDSIKQEKDIVSFSKKALDINGRLLQLGYIQGIISSPVTDSTFFNINNERTQAFIGTNPASDLFKFISQLEKLDENTLDGTQYEYLATDSFVKGSVILNRLFDKKGNKIDSSKNDKLLSVVYVGGTDNQIRGRQRESSRLSYKERLVQEINLNLEGYYLNLVPGDASMEWAIYMGNHISRDSSMESMMDDARMIFREYFLSELNLARENRPIPNAKGRKANDLRFFKTILNNYKDGLHEEVIAYKGDPMDVYTHFEKSINKALESYIKRQNESLEANLKQYSILRDTDEGFIFENVAIEKGIPRSQLDKQLTFMNINYMINNIEMHKLIYADPYQYLDELKRIKNFNSPRQGLVSNSPKMNHMFDRIWNKGFKEGEPGWTNFMRDYFRTATYLDVLGVVKDVAGYTDPFMETDGGGIISFTAYRQFRIRVGNWGDAEEKQYEHDMMYESMIKEGYSAEELREFNKENPAVRSAYTAIKPIVSGNKNNGHTWNDILLDKFALYPISQRLLTDIAEAGGKSKSNAMSLYKKMQDEKLDYVVWENSRKVGATDPQEMYNDEGQFNTNSFPESSIINVPFSIMSVQTEVPSKDDGEVTRGSQVTKLITMDMMEAGVPVDFNPNDSFEKRYEAWYKITDEDEKKAKSSLYTEIKHNQDLLAEMTKAGYRSLLMQMGIKQEGDTYEVVDKSKAATTLRRELLKREVNDNITDALNAFIDGKSVLEATPAYQQVRNILYSIVDREVISQKINGGMKVLIPVSLFEENKIKGTPYKDKKGRDRMAYTSDTLDFYTNADGKRVCQIMISRWFESDMSDKELLKYINTTTEGQKLLSGIGFRIPTQRQNSVESFEVKQFLPREFGDNIVLPSAMVAKTGGDFDIDKLTVYLKNVTKGKKGKPVLIEYLTDANSTAEERYYKWVLDNANIDTKKYVRVLAREEIRNIREEFKAKFDELSEKYKTKVSMEKDRLYQSMLDTFETLDLSEQDQYMQQLFDAGKDVFFAMSDNAREDYWTLKDQMRRDDVKGPKEIENYLALTLGKIERNEHPKDIEYLLDMVKYYEEELRVLGATAEYIKEFKKVAIEDFRAAKISAIQRIGLQAKTYTEKIKADYYDENTIHNLAVAEEIAKREDLPTFGDFRVMPIEQQNTKLALQNQYIQSMQNLASHPLNYDRLIDPNSAEELKDLAIEIAASTMGQSFNYTEVSNMMNREFMSKLRHAFVSGKQAIGITAVNQTNHSLNQRQLIYIDPSRLKNASVEDRKWLGDALLKFQEFNKINMEGQTLATLSMIKNAEGKDISNIIAQFVDGYVDISKGPWIIELGATPNVTSTWLFLIKAGVPVRTVAYFMNQPIIRDYLRSIESAGYSWLFMEGYVKEMIEKYDSGRETKVEQTQLPSEAALKKMMSKRLKSDENAGADYLNADELEKQVFVLKEFMKYAKMSEHMFHVTQGTNFDTATFNDPLLIFKKLEQLRKARNTIINDVDDLLDGSFVGTLGETIQDVRKALSQLLISDQKRVTDIIHQVLLPYVNLSDRDFLKIAQKAINDLFDYAVQIDQKFNKRVVDILVNDGGVASEIQSLMNNIKKDKSHPLYDNYIIGHEGVLQIIPSRQGKNTGVNNVKIKALGSKVYDQNNVIYAFREIRNYLNNTKEDSFLYDRIMQLAVLQSGLSRSNISFTSLVPHEDFEKIYNKTLANLSRVDDLENFTTLNVFQRNNWDNDDIVPYRKAVLILRKGKKPIYNPAMAFFYKNIVKKAIEEGDVPPLLAQAQNEKEANFKHMVYTWEKYEELITPAYEAKFKGVTGNELIKKIKADMRSRGDFSYINKGLFEMVTDSEGVPLPTGYTNANGDWVDQYVYKMINAWGDGRKANEFYATDKPSKIDNGFIKTFPINNSEIIDLFEREGNGSKRPLGSRRTTGEVKQATDIEKQEITKRLEDVINDTARHWLTKEQFKTTRATQFIGQGAYGSSTYNYAKLYNEYGLANTGRYNSKDLIYVSSNGKRGGRVVPIVNGELNGAFENIDLAIAAKASFIMDTAAHIERTKEYNIGEIALAEYLRDNGYIRDDKTGIWTPASSAMDLTKNAPEGLPPINRTSKTC